MMAMIAENQNLQSMGSFESQHDDSSLTRTIYEDSYEENYVNEFEVLKRQNEVSPFIVFCPITSNVNSTAVELRVEKNIFVENNTDHCFLVLDEESSLKLEIQKCICKNMQMCVEDLNK